MKYVIIRVMQNGCYRYLPFIFPETQVHAEVAQWAARSVGWDNREGPAETYSAGFCHINDNEFKISAHGSESLRIDHSPSQGLIDHRILNLPRALQNMLPEDIGVTLPSTTESAA